mmetsp:Transcript_2168/g.7245  ORF Transcript_2168/g.7245 Transcript_2168/m.7245 type:complete len:293 (-) Transcript_2168:296-1174(-)
MRSGRPSRPRRPRAALASPARGSFTATLRGASQSAPTRSRPRSSSSSSSGLCAALLSVSSPAAGSSGLYPLSVSGSLRLRSAVLSAGGGGGGLALTAHPSASSASSGLRSLLGSVASYLRGGGGGGGGGGGQAPKAGKEPFGRHRLPPGPGARGGGGGQEGGAGGGVAGGAGPGEGGGDWRHILILGRARPPVRDQGEEGLDDRDLPQQVPRAGQGAAQLLAGRFDVRQGGPDPAPLDLVLRPYRQQGARQVGASLPVRRARRRAAGACGLAGGEGREPRGQGDGEAAVRAE